MGSFVEDGTQVPLIHTDVSVTYGTGDIEASPRTPNGICQTCGSFMEKVYDGSDPGWELCDRGYYCLRCGWWYCATLINRSWAHGSSITKAALKIFLKTTHADKEACSELLLQEQTFLAMEPRKFEIFVQTVFRHYFDCEVRHIGKSHDGGLDLLVVTHNEGILPVQVKRRYKEGVAESVSVIREFLGAMVSQGYKRGLFVSSAERFSRSAKNTSKSDARSLIDYDIKLLDCGSLLSMCGLLNHNRKPMQFHSSNGAWNTEKHFAECRRKVEEFNQMLSKSYAARSFEDL